MKIVSYFKQFQEDIRLIYPIWRSEDVYFSQTRDSYSAEYRPKYPDYCTDDMIIQTIDRNGSYLNRNYELIIYEDGKYTSKYFDEIDEIKEFLEDLYASKGDAIMDKNKEFEEDLETKEKRDCHQESPNEEYFEDKNLYEEGYWCY